jgi:hypothetical protein
MPVGSAIKSHDTEKTGVTAGGFAKAVTTIKSLIIRRFEHFVRPLGPPNPGTYLSEWNRQTTGEAL